MTLRWQRLSLATLIVISFGSLLIFYSRLLSTTQTPHALSDFENGKLSFERRSWARAQYFMQKAYDTGDTEAGYYLGQIFRMLYDTEDPRNHQIPNFLEPLARQGRADCQRELGFYYFDQNQEALAIEWMQAAAEQGDVLAECRLRLHQIEKKNYQECSSELETLSTLAQDSMPLMYQLGVARLKCDPQNLDFVSAIQDSAEKGYFPAQEHLGRIYLYPNPWVAQDYEQSRAWLEKSAVHGYLPAMYQLGLWHFSHDLDNTQAIHWIERAATKGHPDAQYFMGRHAELAPFPQSNIILDWYHKAASQNSLEAYNRLGVLYAHGAYDLPRDYQISRDYFFQAAQQGLAKAQNNLGLLYFYHTVGSDLDQDEQAFYWFEKAAAQGYQSAIHNLATLTALQDSR